MGKRKSSANDLLMAARDNSWIIIKPIKRGARHEELRAGCNCYRIGTGRLKTPAAVVLMNAVQCGAPPSESVLHPASITVPISV
jgi:hypothetical protein